MADNKDYKKIVLDAQKIEQTNLNIAKTQQNEIEFEKKIINEEIERNKRYLIEEVLIDGESLLKEIERREKKSLWSKFMDFIFK